jgi:membrane-associated protease RseP (regulator of RpoE activity)
MTFLIYDLAFLILFSLFIAVFLYKRRKNLKREMGIAFLFKTHWGVRLINSIGKKYRKILSPLRYVIILVGYVLMAGIIYLIAKTAYLYFAYPILITDVVKAPPVTPLIPYFPTIFGMESFFPPLYFTYFILALSIVAIVHEFSHGIYMAFHKVRIKSTGILFLGPLLGAFVEQNEEDMKKLGKIGQMSILGAGVFANIITAGVFLLIWMGLFYVTFIPTGALFNTYAIDSIPVSSITMLGNMEINNASHHELIRMINKNNISKDIVLGEDEEMRFTKVIANGKRYYVPVDFLKGQLELEGKEVIVYGDYPAINLGLKGTIIEFDGHEIKSHDQLVSLLKEKSPGDSVQLKTRYEGELFVYDLTLEEHPDYPKRAMLGIGNSNMNMNIAEEWAFFKDPFTEYETKHEFLVFVYYLVFWIFIINLLVGFFNMLPVSILDGGRFFYLTVWGITGSKKIGKAAYKWVGILILAMFVLMMASWLFGITS